MADGDNKDEPKKDDNTITIPISEYNSLKAKDGEITALKGQITSLESLKTSLTTDLEAAKKVKPKDVSKEEIETQLRNEFQEKLDNLQNERNEFEKKFKGAVVTDRVINQLKNEKLFDWAIPYVRSQIEKECDLDGENLVIKDENGNPRWSQKTANEKMKDPEYIELFKAKSPQFFGSNARGNVQDQGQNMGNQTHTFTDLTLADCNNMSDEELRKVPPAVLDAIMNSTTKTV